MTIIGAAVSLIGGSHDKFVSGLVYSGALSQCVEDIFRSKMKAIYALRDIEEMEKMFNGHAAEEEEKEKTRVGTDRIESNDISIKGVTINAGNSEILKNANLEIPSGTMVRLGGRSGSGKTTLMKVITGYYKPESGAVSYGGVDIDG